jgi:hypothetical protein
VYIRSSDARQVQGSLGGCGTESDMLNLCIAPSPGLHKSLFLTGSFGELNSISHEKKTPEGALQEADRMVVTLVARTKGGNEPQQ